MSPHDDTEEEYNSVADSVTLPDWMDYPTADPIVYRIVPQGDLFAVEGTDEKFDTIEEAYDYISDVLDGTPDILEIESSGMIFTPGNRILFSYTPEDRLRANKHSYRDFQNLHQRYVANPKDFLLSYQLLKTHPAFYYRLPGDLNRWQQEDGLHNLDQSAYMGENHTVCISLELGANTDPQRIGTSRYGDYRLEVVAPTFEEAYILLAKRVNKFFTPDGIDTNEEGVRPQWMKEVAERINNDGDEVTE